MLDYAFMEKALPFLLKAIPVTLGLTFLVLVLSFLPALFLADRRICAHQCGGWADGSRTDHRIVALADLPRSHYSTGPLFCGAESL